MKPQILVVDDELSHCRMLEAVLTEEGYMVEKVYDGEDAVKITGEKIFDLILIDIKMKKLDGISALKQIKKLQPDTPIIMMTAYASLNTAVEALKTGACDYLTKPLNTDELLIIIKKNIHYSNISVENKFLKERLKNQYQYSNIIGSSSAMKRVFETISQAAPTDATILILGKSGTGKEMIANAIHENSLRKDGPFVKINCAALPETLLESELFGHVKGAFTGAEKTKKGRFAIANGGTIFLDEIGEMSKSTQVKLLRVLQEQELDPVGSTHPEKIDIRVIAATNKNLEKEIEKGNFREDLYYRLNVISIVIPSLQERINDIKPLTDFFIHKYAERNNKNISGFTPKAYEFLMNHTWPGNVRELENIVERAVILSNDDPISEKALPDTMIKNYQNEKIETYDQPGFKFKTLKEAEKEIILIAIKKTNGNRTHAAKLLDISRRTLQLKLKEYGTDF